MREPEVLRGYRQRPVHLFSVLQFHCSRYSYRICVNDYAVSGRHDVITLNIWEEREETEKINRCYKKESLSHTKLVASGGCIAELISEPVILLLVINIREKNLTKTSIA